MEHDTQKFLRNFKKQIRLTPEEKSHLRQKLINELNLRALPPTRFSWHLALVPLSLVVIVGGSLSLAAERALPGDLLYPVKTKVNEEVTRVFIENTTEAQIAFDTKLIEKRLIEAELLDQEQKLVPSRIEEVRKEVIKQAAKINQTAKIKTAPPAAVMMEMAMPSSTARMEDEIEERKPEKDELARIIERHEAIIEKLEIEITKPRR